MTATSAITKEEFLRVVDLLGAQGEEDIAWAEALCAPTTPENFALETIFVVCNSGMRYTVARGIHDRCVKALADGTPVFDVFKHPGKVAAIEHVWAKRRELLDGFLTSPDRLAYLKALPWIGGITKFHLAKNFGLDVSKPDVHLQRLADREGVSAQALCQRLAVATGWRIATVDTLLWRACADGIIDSRTGQIRGSNQ